jgi:hypothetical protein
MMQNELITKRPTAAIGEEIGYQLGTEFISNYRNANPNGTLSYAIGKNIIEQILAQPGCEGIRFYNAIDENGKKTLVYVGIDKDGKNIFEYTAVNKDGNITNEEGIVGDRTDGEGSWWKWIFGL